MEQPRNRHELKAAGALLTVKRVYVDMNCKAAFQKKEVPALKSTASSEIKICMDKKSLSSDETKFELFGHNDLLLSLVVVALCFGVVLKE